MADPIGLEELDDLGTCLDAGEPARVLLRYRPDSAGRSRFGMSREGMVQALRRLGQDRPSFVFEGFHLHLSGYGIESRVAAMEEVSDLVDTAAGLGLSARLVDIGGGMPIRYVDPDAYATVLGSQRPEHYQNGRVPADFYPYGSALTAADWLDGFLQAPCRGGTIAGYLRAAGLRLAIEPGRSLVDQAAISVFRVTRTKPLGAGRAVIFVEGSSFSACETWFASEFLVDPILLPAAARQLAQGGMRAFIAGHSCLDGDIVTHRLLEFGTAPRPGDLLIYANTAGYQMDLLENEFHRHPMPVRLVAEPSSEAEFIVAQDM